jgi:hypothetical protein
VRRRLDTLQPARHGRRKARRSAGGAGRCRRDFAVFFARKFHRLYLFCKGRIKNDNNRYYLTLALSWSVLFHTYKSSAQVIACL